MFPHYPPHVVEADLARTGSVELTLENILSGALVREFPDAPPRAIAPFAFLLTSNFIFPLLQPAPPPPPSQSVSGSETPASLAPSPYLQAALSRADEAPEPEKKWEQTTAGREANLRARKEHMVRMARERAAKAAAEAVSPAPSASASATSKL
ncbi:hypothetical protein BC830DRAFT_1125236, partial [Chytriomyces sp. MP71]